MTVEEIAVHSTCGGGIILIGFDGHHALTITYITEPVKMILAQYQRFLSISAPAYADYDGYNG